MLKFKKNMVMKISEIITNGKLNVKDNVINLGYENGWYYSEKMVEAYNNLEQLKIEGSNTSRTIGRCETEYTFQVTDGDETYTVISKVDSGD
jgi:hypothetical protein